MSTNSLSRQQKRAFHRAISGLECHHGKRKLRFLTFTSPDGATHEGLTAHFRVITWRIKRLTPRRLVRLGYLSASDVPRYYPDGDAERSLEFDYMAVWTAEGNGVIHVLYAGDYIPQKWLSDTWLELHGAWSVDIRATYGSMRSIAGYLIQYCAGQHKFLRYSWSEHWVWAGFARDWQYLLKCGRCAAHGRGAWAYNKWPEVDFQKILELWRWHLRAGIPLPRYEGAAEAEQRVMMREFMRKRHKGGNRKWTINTVRAAESR